MEASASRRFDDALAMRKLIFNSLTARLSSVAALKRIVSNTADGGCDSRASGTKAKGAAKNGSEEAEENTYSYCWKKEGRAKPTPQAMGFASGTI